MPQPFALKPAGISRGRTYKGRTFKVRSEIEDSLCRNISENANMDVICEALENECVATEDFKRNLFKYPTNLNFIL